MTENQADNKELIDLILSCDDHSKGIDRIAYSIGATITYDGDDYRIDHDGLIRYGSTPKSALLTLIATLEADCDESLKDLDV